MPRFRLAALVAAIPLVLAGCSSGSKSPSAAVGSTSTTRAPASNANPPSTRAAGANPFCDYVQAFSDRFGGVNTGLADPQQLRSTLLDAAAALKDAQSKAPDELRADVGLLNDAFQRLVTAFQQANFDVTKVSPAVLDQLNTPQYTAASQRLENYMRTNCL